MRFRAYGTTLALRKNLFVFMFTCQKEGLYTMES